jgi:hypothetical protein
MVGSARSSYGEHDSVGPGNSDPENTMLKVISTLFIGVAALFSVQAAFAAAYSVQGCDNSPLVAGSRDSAAIGSRVWNFEGILRGKDISSDCRSQFLKQATIDSKEYWGKIKADCSAGKQRSVGQYWTNGCSPGRKGFC